MSAIDMQSFDGKHTRTARVDAPLDVCRCGQLWPCPSVLQERITEALAEIERLTAIVQRVEALRKRWSRDVIATLGKPMPGGVLSVSLHSAECQLGRALRGESGE